MRHILFCEQGSSKATKYENVARFAVLALITHYNGTLIYVITNP